MGKNDTAVSESQDNSTLQANVFVCKLTYDIGTLEVINKDM